MRPPGEGARGPWGSTRNLPASRPIATYVQTTAIRSGPLPRRNHHADLSGEVAAQTVPRAHRHHPRSGGGARHLFSGTYSAQALTTSHPPTWLVALTLAAASITPVLGYGCSTLLVSCWKPLAPPSHHPRKCTTCQSRDVLRVLRLEELLLATTPRGAWLGSDVVTLDA